MVSRKSLCPAMLHVTAPKVTQIYLVTAILRVYIPLKQPVFLFFFLIILD